ncbi:hypothetical protein [Methanothrix sp.]|jgi:hypothetical protein|uniref:hypothetical protein n=1 Tax=Methanothrix sp. TaxID=90426 RepID=UPI001BD344C9
MMGHATEKGVHATDDLSPASIWPQGRLSRPEYNEMRIGGGGREDPSLLLCSFVMTTARSDFITKAQRGKGGIDNRIPLLVGHTDRQLYALL